MSDIAFKAKIYQIRLSGNFTLGEMLHSDTAAEKEIANAPTNWAHLAAMRHLAQSLLQPARMHIGSPIAISSGYRSATLNSLIGGAPSSQHTKGEAADWNAVGVPTLIAAHVVAREIKEFDQLIFERRVDTRGNVKTWIHSSAVASRPNRKELLSINMDDGGKKVIRGLPPESALSSLGEWFSRQ